MESNLTLVAVICFATSKNATSRNATSGIFTRRKHLVREDFVQVLTEKKQRNKLKTLLSVFFLKVYKMAVDSICLVLVVF